MKLRLQSNSIRLRLKRAEVEHLAKVGRVEEQILLGSTAEEVLTYVIETRDNCEGLRATLHKNRLVVEAPVQDVAKWATQWVRSE